jgi:hypothetical protein
MPGILMALQAQIDAHLRNKAVFDRRLGEYIPRTDKC